MPGLTPAFVNRGESRAPVIGDFLSAGRVEEEARAEINQNEGGEVVATDRRTAGEEVENRKK